MSRGNNASAEVVWVGAMQRNSARHSPLRAIPSSSERERESAMRTKRCRDASQQWEELDYAPGSLRINRLECRVTVRESCTQRWDRQDTEGYGDDGGHVSAESGQEWWAGQRKRPQADVAEANEGWAVRTDGVEA
ncbi:hypothetical protein DFH09DRAFT_1092997 [Mycena vulgaris]|nr:hypothetical protein DFH09DRAFT_1092997 [Mycena vulgaris]